MLTPAALALVMSSLSFPSQRLENVRNRLQDKRAVVELLEVSKRTDFLPDKKQKSRNANVLRARL